MLLLILTTLVVYFSILYVVSRRSEGRGGNDDFFRARRRSPWQLVAFGMIGASISGVSLISVPGWVQNTHMTYLQMCMGFIVGYFLVALVLLPLYYRLRLTSIYAYLDLRFGRTTQRAGAFFFFLSKLTGAAARLYLVVLVITQFFGGPRGEMPLWGRVAVAAVLLILIYIYTRRSGIRTIVRTDVFQTACMLLALAGIAWAAVSVLGLDFRGAWQMVAESPMSQVFEWDGQSRQAFWRQFLSGIFIVVVMTGLDQDMMQKNLTCRNLRDARRNMCAYGIAFLPINALLLALGILLYAVAAASPLTASLTGDALLPALVADGSLGTWVVVPFTIGVVAAAFSSADSALTSLTTSFCIDLLGIERSGYETGKAERTRKLVHAGMGAAFLACMTVFSLLNDTSIINTIYVMASYTYGPLLGLYAFGLLTRRRVRERWVPVVAVASPVVCGLLDFLVPRIWNYDFGYELLLINGILTFILLSLLPRERNISAKDCLA